MTTVSVIGCGFMGQNHVHAVADHPTLELDSVVDIDGTLAENVARRYDANRALTDVEEALDRADAAIIATPESAHEEQATLALDRGVHTLLEKPITEDLADARALAARASDTDLVTGVSFVLRYDPGYAGIRRAISNGELGRPIGVRAMRGITAAETRRIGHRGHPMYYMSVHDIDAMRWCLDAEADRVHAIEHRGELADVGVPDAMFATLEFDNGTIGVLEGYGTLPESTPGGIVAGLDVTGLDGRASTEAPGSSLEVYGDRYDRPDTRHWPVVNERMDGCVRRQVDRFAQAIHDDGELLASLEDGYRAQATASAIKSAVESDRSVPVDY